MFSNSYDPKWTQRFKKLFFNTYLTHFSHSYINTYICSLNLTKEKNMNKVKKQPVVEKKNQPTGESVWQDVKNIAKGEK